MRFLVTVSQDKLMPPEHAYNLFEATQEWIRRHTSSRKMESAWAFAGVQGGGGILDVDSAEELDAIMAGFPMGPFCRIEVQLLADVMTSFEHAKEAVKAMTGGMAQ